MKNSVFGGRISVKDYERDNNMVDKTLNEYYRKLKDDEV